MGFKVYRFPKTKHEATQYYVALEYCDEIKITVRSKRQAKVLPDVYNNDFELMRKRVRCWKAYRKTQWKNKMTD